MNFERFSLDYLRRELRRLEETLIFGILERSQFSENLEIYASFGDCLSVSSDTLTIGVVDREQVAGELTLVNILHQLECVFSRFRRYTSPDELPFTHPLPEPQGSIQYPQVLSQNTVNINKQILSNYHSQIISRICLKGNDGNLGSSCTRDVEVLQTLSKRIHLGKFVAEAKYTESTPEYDALIQSGDAVGIMDLLTNTMVEEELLQRVYQKASVYCHEMQVDPQVIQDIYRDFVIPLTKQVEVEYLLQKRK